MECDSITIKKQHGIPFSFVSVSSISQKQPTGNPFFIMLRFDTNFSGGKKWITLTGTLPRATEQNNFYGIPAYVPADENHFSAVISHTDDSTKSRSEALIAEIATRLKLYAPEIVLLDSEEKEGGFKEFMDNLSSVGLVDYFLSLVSSLNENNAVDPQKIKNTILAIPIQLCYSSVVRARTVVMDASLPVVNLKKQSLWKIDDFDLNPVMLSGSKFGGAFCFYPGAPCRFHSTFIVHSISTHTSAKSEFTFQDLVRWGRMANVTHKSALLIADDKSLYYFTLKWSGW